MLYTYEKFTGSLIAHDGSLGFLLRRARVCVRV